MKTKKRGRPFLPKTKRRVAICVRLWPEAFAVLQKRADLAHQSRGQTLSQILVALPAV